ncbi:MAG: CHRD domain-containing protein [Chitinophagaceae bacterium]
MKLFRLTAMATVCLGLITGFTSCEKDSEKDKVNLYQKSDIPMTGAQVAPNGTPSAGLGSLTVSYDKRQKQLNYSISWSGLSDSVVAVRVNGPAPIGFPALNPAFTGANPTSYATTPYVVLQQFTGQTSAPFRPLYPGAGTYSGTLQVDNVKVREQDLLNGLYYITIHTKTILPVASPGNLYYRWFGEIRGQIVFQ